MTLAGELRYDSAGLVPVVLQDRETLEVLILAFMNREAVERTLSSGVVHLWSRSRQAPWLKGETSGRVLRVCEVRPNCELDSLLVLVDQALPGACHTGHSSCYYRRLSDDGLEETSPSLFDPEVVYHPEKTTRPLEELLAAYAWIRDAELIAESGTSRALHGLGPDPLERLRDEWDELLGVLHGTHTHTGFEEDAALEAYQVLYWTCLHQVSSESRQTGTPSLCSLAPLAQAALVDGDLAGRDLADLVRDGLSSGNDVVGGLDSVTGLVPVSDRQDSLRFRVWSRPSRLELGGTETRPGRRDQTCQEGSEMRASARDQPPEERLRGLWAALGIACRSAGLDPLSVVQRDLGDLCSREYMRAYAGVDGTPRGSDIMPEEDL